MWRFDVNGTELYDARARLWAPELGSFLSIDEYAFHDRTSTLWGWPSASPVRHRDPSGRFRENDPRAERWGDYAATHLDDPNMHALAGVGTATYGGLAATGAFAPFLFTSEGIALWGGLQEMGAVGRFIALALGAPAGAALVNQADKPSLPGQMSGAGQLAGQCVEKAEQSNAHFGGNIVHSPYWNHVANQLPNGMVHDPTLRANLSAMGRTVSDIPSYQTMFTFSEWLSLNARFQ